MSVYMSYLLHGEEHENHQTKNITTKIICLQNVLCKISENENRQISLPVVLE